MALTQYDIVAPDNKLNVVKTVGASIGGSAVRITIDDVNATSETDVLLAIEAISQRIREDTWPISAP